MAGEGSQGSGLWGLEAGWLVGAAGSGVQRAEGRGLAQGLAGGLRGGRCGASAPRDRLKGRRLRARLEEALGTVTGGACGAPSQDTEEVTGEEMSEGTKRMGWGGPKGGV